MPLIIDTFNVLHSTGVLPPDLSGMDVEELRGVITLSRFRHQAIRFVCDGVEPIEFRRRGNEGVDSDRKGGFENILMMWSGSETDADSIIEILVAQDSAPRRLTVVTSDRRLGREVRKRRARVMTSEAFLDRLSHDFRTNVGRSSRSAAGNATARPPMAYDVPLHPDSVRWWLEYLEMDPDEPMIEGRLIASASEKSAVADQRAGASIANDKAKPGAEADPIRWWLRYFGFDPDRLPEELLVEASPIEAGTVEPTAGGVDVMSQAARRDSTTTNQVDDIIVIDDIDPEAFL